MWCILSTFLVQSFEGGTLVCPASETPIDSAGMDSAGLCSSAVPTIACAGGLCGCQRSSSTSPSCPCTCASHLVGPAPRSAGPVEIGLDCMNLDCSCSPSKQYTEGSCLLPSTPSPCISHRLHCCSGGRVICMDRDPVSAARSARAS